MGRQHEQDYPLGRADNGHVPRPSNPVEWRHAASAPSNRNGRRSFGDESRGGREWCLKRLPVQIGHRRGRFHQAPDCAAGRCRREEAPRGAGGLAAIPDPEEFLGLATGRYIGEGFDDARLDTLFLTMPVSWWGTVVQYTGRLHRLHPAKTEVRIYDYVDRRVPVLARMYERRLTGYRAIGYERSDETML